MKILKANDARDPVQRMVDKGDFVEEMSPMDPPDAYTPPGDDQAVAYDDMHALLQGFRDDHQQTEPELAAFIETLDALTAGKESPETDAGLNRFFTFLDDVLLPHNRREERVLFPLLARRLVQSGEHGNGRMKTTAVDVLKADHMGFMQLAAVMTNFFRFARGLPDEASRKLMTGAAVHQGRTLVEQVRLHIFREDHVVFSLAHKLLSQDELDSLARGESVLTTPEG